MAKQGYRISVEIKEEIITKIKHDGLSVMDAAKQYGISDKTIYNWLGTKAKGIVSIFEYNINVPLLNYIKSPKTASFPTISLRKHR